MKSIVPSSFLSGTPCHGLTGLPSSLKKMRKSMLGYSPFFSLPYLASANGVAETNARRLGRWNAEARSAGAARAVNWRDASAGLATLAMVLNAEAMADISSVREAGGCSTEASGEVWRGARGDGAKSRSAIRTPGTCVRQSATP